jgi:hypothetical protein
MINDFLNIVSKDKQPMHVLSSGEAKLLFCRLGRRAAASRSIVPLAPLTLAAKQMLQN